MSQFDPRKAASALSTNAENAQATHGDKSAELEAAQNSSVTVGIGCGGDCAACGKCIAVIKDMIDQGKGGPELKAFLETLLSDPAKAEAWANHLGDEKMDQMLEKLQSADPEVQKKAVESFVAEASKSLETFSEEKTQEQGTVQNEHLGKEPPAQESQSITGSEPTASQTSLQNKVEALDLGAIRTNSLDLVDSQSSGHEKSNEQQSSGANAKENISHENSSSHNSAFISSNDPLQTGYSTSINGQFSSSDPQIMQQQVNSPEATSPSASVVIDAASSATTTSDKASVSLSPAPTASNLPGQPESSSASTDSSKRASPLVAQIEQMEAPTRAAIEKAAISTNGNGASVWAKQSPSLAAAYKPTEQVQKETRIEAATDLAERRKLAAIAESERNAKPQPLRAQIKTTVDNTQRVEKVQTTNVDNAADRQLKANITAIAQQARNLDLGRLAQMLRLNQQLVQKIGIEKVEALSKKIEQITKNQTEKDQKELSPERRAALTKEVIREMVKTLGREETVKLVKDLRQQQVTERRELMMKVTDRVAANATATDITKLTKALTSNELVKKLPPQVVEKLTKDLEALAKALDKNPSKLEQDILRKQLKVVLKTVQDNLGKDGDRLIREMNREIRARQIQLQQMEPLLAQLRATNAAFTALPNGLQRMIALYLLQKLAADRSAQDLYEMIKEANQEWADRIKLLDLEKLMMAGLDVMESDGAQRRKRRSAGMPLDLDADRRNKKNLLSKGDTMSGATSGSKLAAQTSKSTGKAQSSGPSADLIIARIKGDKKPADEDMDDSESRSLVYSGE